MIEQSENIAELVKAMVAASGQFTHPIKNATNPHFRSKYADLHAVIDAYRKAYTDAGLVVMQMVAGEQLVTQLCHSSGQWIRYSVAVKPERKGIQAYGSELTYMRRYTLQALTGIAADDDDDGNKAQADSSAGQNQNFSAPKQQPTAAKDTAPLSDRILNCATTDELAKLVPEVRAIEDAAERKKVGDMLNARRKNLLLNTTQAEAGAA